MFSCYPHAVFSVFIAHLLFSKFVHSSAHVLDYMETIKDVLGVHGFCFTSKIARKTFSITKSVVCEDGVAVVRPVGERDAVGVSAICRRVTGWNEHFGIYKEYEL